ncbi:MAG TPA: Fic family protein [Flavobacteriales bacterium]|nr:Fic family protein [Flavobacteriales bacterium]
MDDLEGYLRQGEPNKAEKARVWRAAIGLQQVDGLRPSDYLIAAAKLNIEGEITIEEVKQRINSYYAEHPARSDTDRTEEADKVSARIAEVLGEQTFTFSSAGFIAIHRRLFQGTFPFAGRLRDYNITKPEWVLNGETVLYAGSDSLKAALDHDIEQERKFSYKGLDTQEVVEHLALFVSNLWQIHPFGEGNTRTTAVFLLKYLRKLGFKGVNNDLFAAHSWYFRNALVRANYEDLNNGIHKTDKHLLRFLSTLLLNEEHPLKNREMHVDHVDTAKAQNDPVKPRIDPVNDLVIDPVKRSILHQLEQTPNANYSTLADRTGYSAATIKRHLQELKRSGMIERIGSDKTGHWKIKRP